MNEKLRKLNHVATAYENAVQKKKIWQLLYAALYMHLAAEIKLYSLFLAKVTFRDNHLILDVYAPKKNFLQNGVSE